MVQPHSLSPMPQLLSEDRSPAGVAEPHEPQPQWCPDSRARWAFSELGNSMDLHGAGLMGAGLGTCTVPASVHVSVQVFPTAESPGSLEAEYLEEEWRLLRIERQRFLPGLF